MIIIDDNNTTNNNNINNSIVVIIVIVVSLFLLPYTPAPTLRSQGSNLHTVPKFRLSSMGDTALMHFLAVCERLSLLIIFKPQLKSHLF